MPKAAKKWVYGTPEPEVDDGNPDRVDFTNATGLKLAGYKWSPPEGTAVRGITVLCHGTDTHARHEFLKHTTEEKNGDLTFHETKFEGSIVEKLIADGFLVYGLDLQSFGLSEGLKGLRSYFNAFQDLIDDVVAFTKDRVIPDANDASLPVFVVGLSLGGCVAVRALQDAPEVFNGGVMYAPMLSLEQIKKQPMNRIVLPFAPFASKRFPTWKIGSKAPFKFKGEVTIVDADPLCYSGMVRGRVGYEVLKVAERAMELMDKLVSPVLVFQHIKDTMVDPEGAEMLRDKCKSEDKTVVMLTNGMWHCLLNEPGQDELMVQSIEWLNERAKGGPKCTVNTTAAADAPASVPVPAAAAAVTSEELTASNEDAVDATAVESVAVTAE